MWLFWAAASSLPLSFFFLKKKKKKKGSCTWDIFQTLPSLTIQWFWLICSGLKYQPPMWHTGAARWRGQVCLSCHILDSAHLVLGWATFWWCGRCAFGHSREEGTWQGNLCVLSARTYMAHCSQNVGTRTLNSLSPACSFPVVKKTPDLFHFSVSQTPGSDTRIISVTKNTGCNGNRIQEEGRSINSSGVWQSFPVRQKAMDECASWRFCGF